MDAERREAEYRVGLGAVDFPDVTEQQLLDLGAGESHEPEIRQEVALAGQARRRGAAAPQQPLPRKRDVHGAAAPQRIAHPR
jgi:hypothetical protein